MAVFYGITFAVSLAMISIYSRVDRERNLWLMLLVGSVALCNAGYLALSLSRSLGFALAANAAAYLGNIFLPLFVLMMILRLSQVRYPKWLPQVLMGVNTVMFLIASSGGVLNIFYKEVRLEVIDGAAHLVKVYGPMHAFYKVFLFAYFAAMVAVVCYTAVRKTAVSTKHTMFLAFVVVGNIMIWLIENIVGSGFEFLAISYIMTEGLILLLYSILQDFDAVVAGNIAADDNEEACTGASLELQTGDGARGGGEQACSFTEQQMKEIFDGWDAIGMLSQREKEVLHFLLENRKRRDIAQILFVTESTIKKHTSNIFKKLEISNRTQLFDRAREFCKER